MLTSKCVFTLGCAQLFLIFLIRSLTYIQQLLNLNLNRISMNATYVFVDGSYWEQTQQAGAGVYFEVESSSDCLARVSNSFACPDYRSATGAELFASSQALALFCEHRNSINNVLIIKQDCMKAIRMVRLCLNRQHQHQLQQKRYFQESKIIHASIRHLDAKITTLLSQTHEAMQQDQLERDRHEEFARAMRIETRKIRVIKTKEISGTNTDYLNHQIHHCRAEIERLKSILLKHPDQCTTGLIPSSLNVVFADILLLNSNVILDSEHDKFVIESADIIEHLPILQNIVGLMHYCLCIGVHVRWEYVKAHQTNEEAINDHDRIGNNIADCLAKDGSRLCSSCVPSA